MTLSGPELGEGLREGFRVPGFRPQQEGGCRVGGGHPETNHTWGPGIMGRRVRDTRGGSLEKVLSESSSLSGKGFTWAASVGKGI